MKTIKCWHDHSSYIQDKGARIAIMKDYNFDAKVRFQLGDPKSYLPLIQNPSIDYTSRRFRDLEIL